VTPIRTDLHASLDLVVGVLLLALPWIAEFDHNWTLAGVSVGTGAALLATGAMTDYYTGIVRLIPVPVHLAADLAAAAFLVGAAIGVAVAGGGGNAWAPLLGVGVAWLLVTALSERAMPDPYETRRAAFGT
jgi:hypothetical protein